MVDSVGAGPAGNDPGTVPVYGSDEPMWYNNGRWGVSGYAVPNPGGKLFAINSAVLQTVRMLGRGLFEIMHREDRRFIKPLSKDLCWDIYQLIVLARKRLADRAVLPNESELRGEHATPAQEPFILYPVPYFGDAVRNEDLREYCRQILLCMTEAMQHSEADKTEEITIAFAATVGKRLHRILCLMACKYFGYARADVYPKLDFVIPEDKWKTFNYTTWSTSFEMTEERPDPGWYPTENDLRAIRGIPAPVAMPFCRAYPNGGQVFVGGLQFNSPIGEKATGAISAAPNAAFPAPPGAPS